MNLPTLYPPVQPGVCDACVAYTFEILARGASLVSAPAAGAGFIDGTWVDAGAGQMITALDAVGSLVATPGDMAVRGQVFFGITPFLGAAASVPITFEAQDNAGNSVTAVQPFVARSWTMQGTWTPGSVASAGSALTFTSVGTENSFGAGYTPQTTMTFGLSAHGLGVGDRIWLGVIPNSLASPPLSGPQFGFWIVTAVPDTSHFTVQSLAITQAAIATALVADGIAALVTFAAAKDTGGHFLSLAYLCAFQSGRTQNDITSGAEATGTQGAAITPFTIVTDGASTPNAQGVPSGIGLASGILTGTPVQFGWFPVTLIVGTMQRLCLFSIAAGTDEALLLAPQTIMTSPGATALAVVSAPGLAGLTVNWLLGNAVTGVTITSDAPTLATVSGTFATAGTYPFMVFALASNGTILQEEITFEVLGASSSGNVPVIAAPVIPSVAAGAVINSQFYASNEPTVWSANGLPTELTLTAATGTLTGVINFPGVYTFEVIATNGVGSSTPAPVTLTVTVPAGNTIAMNAQQPPQYLGWVMSDLSQIDLQFDLRGRGVTSYHAASGVITLFQNGVCNFALLLFTPAQVSDATTIYLVAKTVEDSVPVIDLTFTGSAALTTVGGGSYYALPVSMQASAITQGFDDMSAPTGGGPRVLALQAQVVALRGGNLYPSLPFTLNIMERIANAGLPGDQP